MRRAVSIEAWVRSISTADEIARMEAFVQRWRERDPCPLVGAVNVPLPFDEDAGPNRAGEESP